MDNKEYRKNQKVQRSSFKKYRKHMLKVLMSFLFASFSAFIFPNNLFIGLNGLLKSFLSEYLAGSITVWTQILCTAGGALSGVINAIKAVKDRDAIDNAQDEEENIVDSLITENDNLLRKVESLEKQKVKENSKSNTKTKSDLIKSNNDIDYEEEVEKKHTR